MTRYRAGEDSGDKVPGDAVSVDGVLAQDGQVSKLAQKDPGLAGASRPRMETDESGEPEMLADLSAEDEAALIRKLRCCMGSSSGFTPREVRVRIMLSIRQMTLAQRARHAAVLRWADCQQAQQLGSRPDGEVRPDSI